jgi:ABC-type Fe3+ transport system permease subunit
VQHHPPTKVEVESREETIARALQESQEVQRTSVRLEQADPSTRRGLNRALLRIMPMLAGAGFIAGAAIGLILSFISGPFEIVGRGNIEGSTDWLQTLLYTLVMGAGFALVVTVIGTLIFLAREDGRVERDVERRTGVNPPAPADPIDPQHDPKVR